MNDDWYEENCPPQEDLNFLLRKMVRTLSEDHDVYHIMGRLNFKYLGPAFIVVMLDGYRDKPQIRFITKQRQRIIIAIDEAKYIKHGGKIQKLHDEDVEMLDMFMRTDAFENVSRWRYILGEYNWWFPRYRIKCEQPDYSKLNSTR